MFPDLSGSEIFLRPGRTDMRKSINGLSNLAQNEMVGDVFSRRIFVFSNGGKLIKILYWDRNGFCLWLKRLEKHRFPWPKKDSRSLQLTTEQLGWLLSGIDFFNAHTELKYSSAG